MMFSRASLLVGTVAAGAVSLVCIFSPSIAIAVENAVPVIDEKNLDKNTITADKTTKNWDKESGITQDFGSWLASLYTMQTITNEITSFVTGGSNGTGEPQIVTNLPQHLQRLGDTQAVSFARGINSELSKSGSPFAESITNALLARYTAETSLAGFYEQSQCTLNKVSNDPDGFLNGDFTKGGLGAWFALTTEDQNNPLTLYKNAEEELRGVVVGAQAARSEELAWGEGFISWCGETAGILGWDTCTNSDGSSGSTKTPGSIIRSQLQKAIALQADKSATEDESTESLSDAIVAFFKDSIFGAGEGLVSLSQPSVTGRPLLEAYRSAIPIADAQQQNMVEEATTLATTLLNKVGMWGVGLRTLNEYASRAGVAAGTLISAAQGASSDTQPSCWTSSTSALVADAQRAETIAARAEDTTQASLDRVAPVTSSAAKLLVLASSVNSGDSVAALYDAVVSLKKIAPTEEEFARVAQDAEITVGAAASPSGSLTVSGGTLADQMALMEQNATAALSSCLSKNAP